MLYPHAMVPGLRIAVNIGPEEPFSESSNAADEQKVDICWDLPKSHHLGKVTGTVSCAGHFTVNVFRQVVLGTSQYGVTGPDALTVG